MTIALSNTFFYMDPRIISNYRHLIGHRRCSGHSTMQNLVVHKFTFSAMQLQQYYLNVPCGHISVCIMPNIPLPPKMFLKFVNALSLCRCYLHLGKGVVLHFKKTPCISLTQGRKKYETSDRQTDDGAWEKQSIRKAQVSYPPIQKKNPKNEQTIKPITTTFPEKTFCFVILVA